MKRTIALIALAVSAAGCVTERTSHGYVLERGETDVTAEAGVDSKETILARYGEPSTIGVFNDDTWFYISTVENRRAFMKEKTTGRSVVAVNFDATGKVESLERWALADGEDINLVDRRTPTRGREMGILEQLLGNVGRLPPPQEGQGPGQGPGTGRDR